jgi:hypothetical protein
MDCSTSARKDATAQAPATVSTAVNAGREGKAIHPAGHRVDCFVASLLAMTAAWIASLRSQ